MFCFGWSRKLKKVFKLWVSEERDNFDLPHRTNPQEEAKGQQIENVTLDLVLFQPAPPRSTSLCQLPVKLLPTMTCTKICRICKKRPDQASDDSGSEIHASRSLVEQIETIEIVDFDVRTGGGHRLRTKLEAIIEEMNPSTRCGRASLCMKKTIRTISCGQVCSANTLQHEIAMKFAKKEEALGIVNDLPQDLDDTDGKTRIPNSAAKSGFVAQVMNQAKAGAQAVISQGRALLHGSPSTEPIVNRAELPVERHDRIQRLTQGERIKLLTDLMDPCLHVTHLDISGTNCKSCCPLCANRQSDTSSKLFVHCAGRSA